MPSSEDLDVPSSEGLEVPSSDHLGVGARPYVFPAEAASPSPSILRYSPSRVLQRSSSQKVSVSALEP